MAFQELTGLMNRLLVDAQALAALTARLRLDEAGVEGAAEVREQLDRVVDSLGVGEQYDGLTERERSILVSFARSYLGQALDLVEDPARAGAWNYDDPVLLQAQGAASAAVAQLIAHAGLGSDSARILDVGTGVAGLAIAFCNTFPDATVVGIEPWEPALAIARQNVASAGLESRITLVATTVQEFDDPDGFDLIWLPTFFIPEPVLDDAIDRIFALTQAGGVVVVGVPYASSEDPVAAAVDALFTVRSGGSFIRPEEATARLAGAGFARTHELARA